MHTLAVENTPIHFEQMVSTTPAMLTLFRTVQRVAPNHQPVLITGESGTGKERVAQSIHNQSTRKTGPFIALNCGALSHHLAESELFGHVRGAFTGALSEQPGALMAANRGTLFLDEIGELPLALQPKLLRALEVGRIRAVGSPRERPVDVRVVAATHRDLHRDCQDGRFRLDLLYRLDVLRVQLPPLRQRRSDIGLLAKELQREHCPNTTLSPGALRRLHGYHWPGNIRELRNVLVRAAVESEGTILESHIAGALPRMTHSDTPPQSLQDHMMHLIRQRLTANGGEHAKTYRELAIPKSTFYRWMKSGSIQLPE